MVVRFEQWTHRDWGQELKMLGNDPQWQFQVTIHSTWRFVLAVSDDCVWCSLKAGSLRQRKLVRQLFLACYHNSKPKSQSEQKSNDIIVQCFNSGFVGHTFSWSLSRQSESWHTFFSKFCIAEAFWKTSSGLHVSPKSLWSTMSDNSPGLRVGK